MSLEHLRRKANTGVTFIFPFIDELYFKVANPKLLSEKGSFLLAKLCFFSFIELGFC